MNGIITEAQARQITGGRKPLIPLEIEQAHKALVACLTLDEAKIWSDKADALAAYAKMYHDDELGDDAKRVKLLAFRRMGEIARELHPKMNYGRNANSKSGFSALPSAAGALVTAGLSRNQANSAIRLTRATPEEFAVALKTPKSPQTVGHQFRGRSEQRHKVVTDEYSWLFSASAGARLGYLRSVLSKKSARDAAFAIGSHEHEKARKIVVEIIEWLDEFERCLPKAQG